MVKNPPSPADAPVLGELSKIGIRPGEYVPTVSHEELEKGIALAHKQIASDTPESHSYVNGWEYDTNLGTYGTSYLLRTLTAIHALGANLAKDAIYPNLEGIKLLDESGKNASYVLHFESDKLPPVKSFWSLTLYDSEGYLATNPEGIHSVGHLTPPIQNTDGSVDIYIQQQQPKDTAVASANWLPTPSEGTSFALTLRLYDPQDAAIDGSWIIPKLRKVDA